MKYLFDTDTCIAALRGRDSAARMVASYSPNDCVVSTVTVFELAVGVLKCRDPNREYAKIAHFLNRLHVLPLEAGAARQAAGIRVALERSGKPIDPYDILLAGQAVVLGLKLVTGNASEFRRVDGLQVEAW